MMGHDKCPGQNLCTSATVNKCYAEWSQTGQLTIMFHVLQLSKLPNMNIPGFSEIIETIAMTFIEKAFLTMILYSRTEIFTVIPLV